MLRNIALVCAICLAPASALANTSTELKSTLQASMQRTIERATVEGALHHINLETGEESRYYPTDRHPMIVQLGDVYVMCAELKTKEGTEHTVDFYMVENGRRYTLIRTEIDNRAPLKELIGDGKAARIK
ncbi:MAG: hypothetical protein AAGD04_01045 [Pseudomonadota bacterium]